MALFRETLHKSFAARASGIVFSTFFRVFFLLLTSLLVLIFAVGLYSVIYWMTVPKPEQVFPVHLQHKPYCARKPGDLLCSFPMAKINFGVSEGHETDVGERVFAYGQDYSVQLELEMPPSRSNRDAGMFMVEILLKPRKGHAISSSRSVMFPYTSSWLAFMKSTVLSGFYLLGILKEKQWIKVLMFDNFRDDSFNPIVEAKVVIHARHVEIYSSLLRINANFAGIRYFMFYWPVTSAFLGIIVTLSLLSLIGIWIYIKLKAGKVTLRPAQFRYESVHIRRRHGDRSRQSGTRLQRSSSLTQLHTTKDKQTEKSRSTTNLPTFTRNSGESDNVTELTRSALEKTREHLSRSRGSVRGVIRPSATPDSDVLLQDSVTETIASPIFGTENGHEKFE